MAVFHRIVKGPRKAKKYIHSFLGGASKYARNVYPAEYFEGIKYLDFGDGKYPAPGNPDGILTIQYGDYLTMPSEDDRKIKRHVVLVDLKKPYTQYEHIREGMEFDVHVCSIR